VSSNRLLIFSKSADPGTVKTRLRKVLTDEQCLSLHITLLKDTLDKVRRFTPVLFLSGSGFLPFDPGVPILMQIGANLGERLSKAFEMELKEHMKVIVIGTDSPTFPEAQIDKALLTLDNHDAVFGPAEDGGYYLIGLRTLIPEIFEGISWGSSTVLEETLAKIGAHSYRLLETYYDVDTVEDLRRLKTDLKNIKDLTHSKDWMQKNFAAD
jgi:rSAM/selenodomain-associated transferase 1